MTCKQYRHTSGTGLNYTELLVSLRTASTKVLGAQTAPATMHAMGHSFSWYISHKIHLSIAQNWLVHYVL